MQEKGDKMPAVLVVDDEVKILNLIARSLTRCGYESLTASNGDEALSKARVQKPDIILLDINMPGIDGFSVLRKLREDPATSLTPVLMLTARGRSEDKILGLKIGADDYLTKPFDLAELHARMDVLLKRVQKMISVNPLTRLPGSPSIQEEVESQIRIGHKFGVAYIDVDNFKAYNDVYGYHQGDLVIVWMALMIQRIIHKSHIGSDTHSPTLGHIGGDDFIIVSELNSIANLCDTIVNEFDKNRSMWYNSWHSLQGYIQTKDRQGNDHRFPLMTLSIAVSTNENRKITCYGQIARITSELKTFAKSRTRKDKSIVVFDRRKSE